MLLQETLLMLKTVVLLNIFVETMKLFSRIPSSKEQFNVFTVTLINLMHPC